MRKLIVKAPGVHAPERFEWEKLVGQRLCQKTRCHRGTKAHTQKGLARCDWYGAVSAHGPDHPQPNRLVPLAREKDIRASVWQDAMVEIVLCCAASPVAIDVGRQARRWANFKVSGFHNAVPFQQARLSAARDLPRSSRSPERS